MGFHLYLNCLSLLFSLLLADKTVKGSECTRTITIIPPSPFNLTTCTSTHTLSVSLSSYCTYNYTFTAFNNCCVALFLLLFLSVLTAVILQPAHYMSVLSLAPSLFDCISSSSCLHWMCRHCLLSLWSNSLLARCLEQLSNLINSIIRPLLLPWCFTRV